MNRIELKAAFLLFIAAFSWGLNFHLAKIMLAETNFAEAGFWRYFFGALALVLLSYPSFPHFREIFLSSKALLLVGVIGLFCFNLFFFWGMIYTSPLNAALLVSLNPILTILFSHQILHTPIYRNQQIGAALALVGTVYLLIQGNFQLLMDLVFNVGDILIIGANIIFALHHVWVKKYESQLSTSHFTLLTNLICFSCFLLIFPFFNAYQVFSFSSNFWWAALGMGLLGTALAYKSWNWGIRQVGAHRGSIFMNVVPLSAALISIFLLKSLYLYHLISGILIMGGVYLSMQHNLKKS